MRKALFILLSLSSGIAWGQKTIVNGVSFVAPSRQVTAEVFDPVVDLGANWVTLMPFAFGRPNQTMVTFSYDRQWWGETIEGSKTSIDMAHEKGLNVLLKPQVWFAGGFFTGDYNAGTEEDWKAFEANYSTYILAYAEVAQEKSAEAFCIGVEFKTFALNRPEYWRGLIKKVRAVYTGPITYAANWDSYKHIAFWDDLDFIGIDAYFPLSEKAQPTKEEIVKGWQPWIEEIKTVQKKFNKSIVFTEYGYRSIDFALKQPWESSYGKEKANQEIQSLAYKAMYEVLDDYDWFLGGFVWKWHDRHEQAGGMENNRFTPQNKPGENALKSIFQKRITGNN